MGISVTLQVSLSLSLSPAVYVCVFARVHIHLLEGGRLNMQGSLQRFHSTIKQIPYIRVSWMDIFVHLSSSKQKT